ncbi:MAG: VanZ family protein [Spirochaetaceae bacterium]|jgi:VanZ family protein|nr:VanZ family protein [Spirochaetaceae bacterium]
MPNEMAGVRHGIFRIVLRAPAPLIVIAIWVLSSQSILPQPKGILGFDKLQHLIAYCALAGSIVLWFPQKRRIFRGFWMVLPAALIASAYGIIDELHQYFVPGRDCNVWDWIADSLGAVIGAAVMTALVRRKKDWPNPVLKKQLYEK